ncbi:4Fe-4S binding protein [bacterium]|nr:4Fe-4S binding protein [bacterium]
MAADVPEVYIRLRDMLHHQGMGFTPTEEGSELSILRRFFTPQEAQDVLTMPRNRYFSPADWASVCGKSEREARELLEDYSKRGLVFRLHRDGEAPSYRVQPMLEGIWEAHINLMKQDMAQGDTGWIMDEAKHFATAWGKEFYDTIPSMRTLPINMSFVTNYEALACDDAEAIIRSKHKFAVVQCLCRTFTAATGGYDDPFKETCLSFDDYAAYYIDAGIGREITMQRTLDLLHECVDRGLVIHVTSSHASEIMCFCEGRTCALLKARALFKGRSIGRASNYTLEIDRDACVGCGACVQRCPATCCAIVDGKSTTDLDLCERCGQCIAACPHGARLLRLNPPEQRDTKLGETIFETFDMIAEERKAIGHLD